MRGRQRLIERREDLGLTREEVAAALSINPKSYARFERGETNLRVGRRPALATILRWSPAELRLAIGAGGQPSVSNSQLVPEWLNLYVTLE